MIQCDGNGCFKDAIIEIQCDHGDVFCVCLDCSHVFLARYRCTGIKWVAKGDQESLQHTHGKSKLLTEVSNG